MHALQHRQAHREACIHAAVGSLDGVVDFIGAWEDDDAFHIVTRWCNGGDLDARLSCRRRMQSDWVAKRVIRPLLQTLAHLHAMRIVHRDVKPENILLHNDRVLLADFGLAINLGEERANTKLGTLDYMSPETLACKVKRDPEEGKDGKGPFYTDAVDVWAVGVLAWELLLGSPPFASETRQQTITRICNGELPPPIPETADIPDLARDFFQRILVRESDERPSAAELLAHPWCAAD